MEKISYQEFLLRQPSFPEPTETDAYYLEVADGLLSVLGRCPFTSRLEAGVVRRISLALTDYLQDISADAGLWRSFVDANRELYGFSVPFHEISEHYVDYELNREDVRFLVWYVVAMLSDDNRLIYPHDPELLEMADRAFEKLEEAYEEAPLPKAWLLARDLEFTDPEDHKAIYALGNWLFLHSYLLTPAYSESLRRMMMQADPADQDAMAKFNKKLEEAEMQDTTGPLALFTPEWVYLILKGKLPKEPASTSKKEKHPYYEAFTRATGGETVRFFGSYVEMNTFFVEALGWEAGKEHLSQAKGAHDYILMVTPYKGMLMARDIARCIKAPQNPLYDPDYAAAHAFSLLTTRGRCPGDLLLRCIEEQWLPDARFPDAGVSDQSNLTLTRNHLDFIARCFLQIYYRGD